MCIHWLVYPIQSRLDGIVNRERKVYFSWTCFHWENAQKSAFLTLRPDCSAFWSFHYMCVYIYYTGKLAGLNNFHQFRPLLGFRERGKLPPPPWKKLAGLVRLLITGRRSRKPKSGCLVFPPSNETFFLRRLHYLYLVCCFVFVMTSALIKLSPPTFPSFFVVAPANDCWRRRERWNDEDCEPKKKPSALLSSTTKERRQRRKKSRKEILKKERKVI